MERINSLERASSLHAAAFAAASPFAHVVIDNFLPVALANAVAAEIPETVDARGCAPGSQFCFRPPKSGKSHESFKSAIASEKTMGNATRAAFRLLRSPRYVRFVQSLTGLTGLFPDPGYFGSGIHVTGPQGKLDVHADFNHLPGKRRTHRRVNTFVYLNHDWPAAYGGHLELWDRNMTACSQRILPTFNRFVAFLSTDFSHHGHPTPMPLPPARARRSLALYYYTKGDRPRSECLRGNCYSMHSTLWQETVGGTCPS